MTKRLWMIPLILLMTYSAISAQGICVEKKITNVIYKHYCAVDSVMAIFSYPYMDSTHVAEHKADTTLYDIRSVVLFPRAGYRADSLGTECMAWRGIDSSCAFQNGAYLDTSVAYGQIQLDSIGTYEILFAIWEWEGSWSPGAPQSYLDNYGYGTMTVLPTLADVDSVVADGLPSVNELDTLLSQRWGTIAVNIDTIIVLDSASLAGIPNVEIAIYNLGGTFITLGWTDGDGLYRYGILPNGTYVVAANLHGYAFMDKAYTRTDMMSYPLADTIYGVAYSPAVGHVRITGNISYFVGGSLDDLQYAEVIYSIGGHGAVFETVGAESSWVSKDEAIVQSDANGDFGFDIIQSANLVDSKGQHPKYNVTIRSDRGKIILPLTRFTAPDGGADRTIQLVEIIG
jgi:hypothetical protein